MKSNEFYDFADFRINLAEKVLLRGEVEIPLTPKVYKTLLILVENAGELIKKDELMNRIWDDRFVEESNLTFNIKMLRKALGDDATKPRFIENVPRRGYRFVAEVRKVVEDEKDDETVGRWDDETKSNLSEQSSSLSEQSSSHRHTVSPSRRPKIFIPLLAVLLVVLVGAGGWQYARSDNRELPVFDQPFAAEKLSTGGKVFHALVSPDGKNVIYTNFSGDKQSIWLRQIETSNNIEIIPPSDDTYAGIALSPDGDSLYFARRSRYGPSDVFRVPIFGGVPVKIISETEGWLSVSPDGKQISFVRCYSREDESCSLWIADAADGKAERKIAVRPKPFRIGDNEFSPDGKTVVFAAGQSENQANEFGLAEVNLETGAERELTTEKFFNIKNLTWLPDQSGLLVTASRIPNKNFRLWRISLASNEAAPLTKDSEIYSSVSVDKTASVIVSTQMKTGFDVSVYQTENPADRRTLTNAVSVAFAPDGKIVFSSLMSGNEEIWSMNPDGGEQRQLTTNVADDSTPVAAPDGNHIFFSSNRTGAAHVWRMNRDGSNQTQITNTEGGFPLYVSPDGRWIYYRSALRKTLWRVSTDAAGGGEELILDRANYFFAFSPDGSQVAFFEKQATEKILNIVSLHDNRVAKTFRSAGKDNHGHLVWSSDGKSLIYRLTDSEYKNNALWRQPLSGAETPQKIADLDGETVESFALAPDGKTYAVVQGGWKTDAVLLRGLR